MLMKISEYRMMFTPSSRPDPRTVRRWVSDGQLYGEQRGGIMYVDPDRLPRPPSLAGASPVVLRIVGS